MKGNIFYIILLFLISANCLAESSMEQRYSLEFPSYDLSNFLNADKLQESHQYQESLDQFNLILNNKNLHYTERGYAICRSIKLNRRLYQFDQAWALINENIDWFEQLNSKDDALKALFYFEAGELAEFDWELSKSLHFLQRSIDIRTEVFGYWHPITAESLLELSELLLYYYKKSHLAEPLAKDALKIFEAHYKSPIYLMSVACHAISNCYYLKSEHEIALDFEKKALNYALSTSHINWTFIPYIYRFLATVSVETSEKQNAIKYARQAPLIINAYNKNDKAGFYYCQSMLAYVLIENDSIKAAIKHINNTLNNLKSEPQYENLKTYEYFLLYHMADAHYRVQNESMYSHYLNLCFDNMQTVFGPCSENSLMQLNEISSRYEELDISKTKKYLEQALECIQSDPEYSLYDNQLVSRIIARNALIKSRSNVLIKKATFSEDIHEFIKIDSLLKADKLTTSWRKSKIESASENRFIYDAAIELCYKHYQKTTNEESIHHAFNFIESNKASILLESLNNSILNKYYKLDDSTALKIDRLNRKIFQLENGDTNLSTNIVELEFLKKELNQFYAELENNSFDRNSLYFANIVSLNKVRAQLEPKEVAIQYYQNDSILYSILASQDTLLFKATLSTGKIEQFINQFQLFKPKIYTKSDIAEYQNLAYEIYKALIGENTFQIDKLIIVPDGYIHNIPFNALVIEKQNKVSSFSDLQYLVNNTQVTHAYSFSHYFKTKEKTFDPVKNIYSLRPFDNSMAKNEFKALKRNFGNVKVNDPQTKRQKLIASLKTADLIHCSTHGIADLSDGNFSYLQIDDSTKIYAHEIGALQTNAQFVYLNSCETNKGKFHKGEGVFSLARSFMQAGTPTVFGSLWKIPDKSSNKIAERIYGRINEGSSLSIALTSTLKDYANSNASPELAHPYYWAGIIHIGQDSKLVISSSSSKKIPITKYLLIIGMLVLSIIYLVIRRAA